jgi:hypothetical protein
MFAVVLAFTRDVLIVKFALFALCGTVTLAGVVAAALSLEVVTTIPLAPGSPTRYTVPVEVDPATTVLGFTCTL